MIKRFQAWVYDLKAPFLGVFLLIAILMVLSVIVGYFLATEMVEIDFGWFTNVLLVGVGWITYLAAEKSSQAAEEMSNLSKRQQDYYERESSLKLLLDALNCIDYEIEKNLDMLENEIIHVKLIDDGFESSPRNLLFGVTASSIISQIINDIFSKGTSQNRDSNPMMFDFFVQLTQELRLIGIYLDRYQKLASDNTLTLKYITKYKKIALAYYGLIGISDFAPNVGSYWENQINQDNLTKDST